MRHWNQVGQLQIDKKVLEKMNSGNNLWFLLLNEKFSWVHLVGGTMWNEILGEFQKNEMLRFTNGNFRDTIFNLLREKPKY